MGKDDTMAASTTTAEDIGKNEIHHHDDIQKPAISAKGKDKAAELMRKMIWYEWSRSELMWPSP
jgi:hypothetical protein